MGVNYGLSINGDVTYLYSDITHLSGGVSNVPNETQGHHLIIAGSFLRPISRVSKGKAVLALGYYQGVVWF